MAKEHYEVWITLEKWDGDSKIDDVITTSMGNIKNLNQAKQAFQAFKEVAFAVKPHLNPKIKIED